KLALYTAGAGIHPATTLPVLLDVGTDNQELLTDPLYLGWRHPRVRGAEYDAFIDEFVAGVRRHFPRAVLQWEDFASANAARLLARYRNDLCTFNDDIQGTGAVALAGLLAAVNVAGTTLAEQRIVFLGAGQAATGIAEQLVAAMIREGLGEEEARATIWMVDIGGLLHAGRADLGQAAPLWVQPRERVAGWELTQPGHIRLEDVVRQVRPTILIGTAAAPGAFTEDIVREMARHVARPIIFPLSNPTSKSEAVPAALLAWTAGRALVATGSPFPAVPYDGRAIHIGQCNNAFIFPGVGLGVVATGARRVSDGMFVAAAQALSALSPARRDPTASLFPALDDLREVSRQVALAVGAEAQRVGLAEATGAEELARRIDATMWRPDYPPLRSVLG
ncbi:MAG: NAD-dependent malic enzyme, partial [uncultured Thermomicrobiales bacterium]